MELDNVAYARGEWSRSCLDLLDQEVLPGELRKPLPAGLQEAQAKAFDAYFEYEKTQPR